MSMYRFSFGKHFSKLINLKNVSSVYQHTNKITITYNCNSSDGLLIFGSGFINQQPHSEIIHFENEQDASKHMEFIENSFNYQKLN